MDFINEMQIDYNKGVSFKRMEEIYNIPLTTIYHFFKENNLLSSIRQVKRFKNYDCEPYITFKYKYLQENKSIKQIAKECSCSISKVQKYLEKHNLTRSNLDSKRIRSKNNINNSDYFNVIDTPEKAYWLGFLMADGSISKNGYYCALSLATKDKDHLNKFAEIFNLPVHDGKRFDKRTNHTYYWSTVTITNKYVVDTLINLGMCNNKTYRLETDLFINIPNEIKRDFIRGYFDGDGSANGNKISITSCSENFLIMIGDHIINSLCIEPYYKYKNGNVICIAWYRQNNLCKFYEYLYADTSIYLSRKKNEIKKFITPTMSRWSNDEISFLLSINNNRINDKEYIDALFSNRTYNAVYRKYKRLQNR
jgi:hypothetical protein